MTHLVLLGDSIFDNAAYVPGEPDVVAQVRALLPRGARATLCAVDGATTQGVRPQVARVPADATHLVLSVGGNDALGHLGILDRPARSTAEVLDVLAGIGREFRDRYDGAVGLLRARHLPLTVCTIYEGNFPEPAMARRARTALSIFNDAIVRTALAQRLGVIDLRQVCNEPADYANPIEPSARGGAKIARAIVAAVLRDRGLREPCEA